MLLEKGYTNIHGIMRRSATFNTGNIDHIFNKLNLHYGDLTDAMNINTIIAKIRPDFIVNFGAQSHVLVSAELENYTIQVNTIGILNILQSVRNLGLYQTCRIYQCGTSEEFGKYTDGSLKLNEDSPKIPVSIYGVSKLAAENICNIYKNAFDMFIVTGTLMNHESPRRGGTFVTKKITNYIGKY
jgi:GDPmannose 4,6-dehydratase